jgi:hypothetical protein
MSTESNKSIEAHLAEIAAEAKRIDPRTAKMVWWYAEACDPYDLGLDLPPEAQQGFLPFAFRGERVGPTPSGRTQDGSRGDDAAPL